MICINNGTQGHTGPPGSHPVPGKYLMTIAAARLVLQSNMRGWKACNDSFKALPNGKTFKNMFDDHTIWINYDPSNAAGDWGWTMPRSHPKDIVISQYALRMGKWSAAATIVHELAHLNGAPGGASHAAEWTVRKCRMMSPGGPYDPSVTG